MSTFAAMHTGAATETVDARANVFLASSNGTGGGELPVQIALPAGSQRVLEMVSVTGTANCCSGEPALETDPDGIGSMFNTNVLSSGGIAGLTSTGSMFLAGVFTNSSAPPADPAPDRLDFFAIGTDFASLSPALDQTFFIGDGRTGQGAGAVQQFVVPAGADTLYLGYLDSTSFSGPPGSYDDNTGALEATFSIVTDTDVDGDGDGVIDSLDNCIDTPNADQNDSNGDGYGNLCDADLNGDCVVNPIDLGIFRGVFFSADADADLNGDGVVNPIDLGIFRSLFFQAPGPSGLTMDCS